MTTPTYVLKVRPEGKGPPGIIRLKHALKLLLRVCGLRCTDYKELSNQQPAACRKETSAMIDPLRYELVKSHLPTSHGVCALIFDRRTGAYLYAISGRRWRAG